MKILSLLPRALLLTGAMVALNATADTRHESPYADHLDRDIKSLSPEDIQEIKRGGGWGMAKAAELNGMPGPRHLLDMRQEIALDQNQIAKIEELFESMQQAAIKEGHQLLELERKLDQQFKEGTIDETQLSTLLDQISQSRSRLRYIHLSAHLSTPTILSAEQIKTYNTLRGYAGKNPCDSVPSGHDETMWRKHNGCD